MPPRVEVIRLPWVQFGDLEYPFHAPQVMAAAFDPHGSAFTVRAFGYRWQARPNDYIPSSGAWEPLEEGLEVYDRDGRFSGAYTVPPNAKTIQIDPSDRILIVGGGRLHIFQNPLRPPSPCRSLSVRLPTP